jgi:hypothetical protein
MKTDEGQTATNAGPAHRVPRSGGARPGLALHSKDSAPSALLEFASRLGLAKLPKLALNSGSSLLCLWSSWDYSCVSPRPAAF